MNGRQLHRGATYVLSLLMVAIGVALVVQHGSAIRVLVGALFLAAGCGRLYVERKRAPRA